MFSGSLVALITPMKPNGDIDWHALYELIEWHIAEGTHGIVVAGTTGEAGMLSDEERYQLIHKTVKQAKNRLPVIAGTGSVSTKVTIELTQAARDAGVDAALVVTPAYVKPTQQGLLQHYEALAKQVNMPILLYNVPGRTACDLLPETVKALAKLPNIVGIKEAVDNPERWQALLAIDNKLDLLSGDDATAINFMFAGGKGVISVTANVAPRLMSNLCKAALAGECEKAEKIQAQLLPLHQSLFVESNPIPTKWALQQMGKIDTGIRLPLTWLSEANQAVVGEALKQVNAV